MAKLFYQEAIATTQSLVAPASGDGLLIARDGAPLTATETPLCMLPSYFVSNASPNNALHYEYSHDYPDEAAKTTESFNIDSITLNCSITSHVEKNNTEDVRTLSDAIADTEECANESTLQMLFAPRQPTFTPSFLKPVFQTQGISGKGADALVLQSSSTAARECDRHASCSRNGSTYAAAYDTVSASLNGADWLFFVGTAEGCTFEAEIEISGTCSHLRDNVYATASVRPIIEMWTIGDAWTNTIPEGAVRAVSTIEMPTLNFDAKSGATATCKQTVKLQVPPSRIACFAVYPNKREVLQALDEYFNYAFPSKQTDIEATSDEFISIKLTASITIRQSRIGDGLEDGTGSAE